MTLTDVSKRVVTITLNPAIDRTVRLESFAYGQVNRAISANEDIGGKGVNVARILELCGVDVMAGGLLGNDNLAVTEALMTRERFLTNWLPVPGKTRTNTKLVTTADRQTTDINEPGFELGSYSTKLLDKLVTKIREWAVEYDSMVFAGSLPPGLPTDTYGHLINICKQVSPDCFVAVDAEGSPLEYALAAGADLIKPNLAELALLTGCCVEDYDNIELAISDCWKLMSKYPLKAILLSNGRSGSLLFTRSSEKANKLIVLTAGSLEVKALSTTGAGDSLLAGYLSGQCSGLDHKHSLARGIACASLAVSRQSWLQFETNLIEPYTQDAFKLIREL